MAACCHGNHTADLHSKLVAHHGWCPFVHPALITLYYSGLLQYGIPVSSPWFSGYDALFSSSPPSQWMAAEACSASQLYPTHKEYTCSRYSLWLCTTHATPLPQTPLLTFRHFSILSRFCFFFCGVKRKMRQPMLVGWYHMRIERW